MLVGLVLYVDVENNRCKWTFSFTIVDDDTRPKSCAQARNISTFVPHFPSRRTPRRRRSRHHARHKNLKKKCSESRLQKLTKRQCPSRNKRRFSPAPRISPDRSLQSQAKASSPTKPKPTRTRAAFVSHPPLNAARARANGGLPDAPLGLPLPARWRNGRRHGVAAPECFSSGEGLADDDIVLAAA